MRRNESNFPAMVKDETCMESITTGVHSSTFQHFLMLMRHVEKITCDDFHHSDIMVWEGR